MESKAHSGVFHLLPLGLRVQNKLEALIDTHMQAIGASKTSLSSITTEALWRQSGRYSSNSELLRIKDRRDSGFLLSPTHEEEITALVASMVHSYKDLPLRLYQTGRKYRDERRPRGGLLRAKEFMMKDLYTFDSDSAAALETYEAVRAAYTAIFDALKVPYLVADADSGNMGGKLSHEYHFVSPKGEDTIWCCDSCNYVANEELATKRATNVDEEEDDSYPLVFRGISTDRSTEILIYVPASRSLSSEETPGWESISSYVNLHAVKRALPNDLHLDTGIEASTLSHLLSSATAPTQTISILDPSLSIAPDSSPPPSDPNPTPELTLTSPHPLTPLHPSDPCPICPKGSLDPKKSIEIAHSFHLATRYTHPLNACLSLPPASASPRAPRTPLQMTCHGIGLTRLIAALAALLHDAHGLNWPRALAPWEAVVLPSAGVAAADAEAVYDELAGGGVDVVLDDRPGKALGWKMRDAEGIGYGVVVVMGRGWAGGGREVEVQCRRLGVRRGVGVEGLGGEVGALLERL
ncbi:hypothetical protein BDU57DRAFT_598420 [Ampelomyces quisqualis]|uniref:proline--tRNA ligase n=1 Tax=Ampelomyces quisqualis TaxID=50730 RepID=A0A6A5Q8L7_AMPQU|nr:hypothetical protein BDU57DRAFT_598420 [Ampelomyces quisqualis]